MPLSVTVKDVAGAVVTDRPVTWATSNADVATVSTAGVVTGVNAGTATITASSGDKSGTSVATVTKVPVGSVGFQPATATVVVGQTATLSPIVKDANGAVVTDRVVTWSSSNTIAATVSSAGVVTGLAVGTSTITATSEGKSGTITVTIVPVPAGSVTVQPATASLVVGQTAPLSATVKDANGTVVTDRTVVWSSSGPAASVSTGGVVTALAVGSATITATVEGKSGSSTVTVTPIAVGSVTLQPASGSIAVGQTTTPAITVKDANGTVVTDRAVAWSSSNSAIASVSSAGVVTGVAPGTATITATSEGKSGTFSVTVTAAAVGSITVQPSTASVVEGQTTALAATVKDANGTVLTDRVVAWSSNNPAVATVSQTGVVTGVAAGSAIITAASESKSATATVTVTGVPVGTVTVSPTSASVAVGQTTPLGVVVKDADGTVVTDRAVAWTSSAPAVATVSPSGVVTGVSAGTATITATSEGKTGSSTVTVTLPPVATVTVSPAPLNTFVGTTSQMTATTKDAAGNVLTGRTIAWTSSNTAVATVSSTGQVTGVAQGSATITATSETKSGTSTVNVGLAPVATVTVTPATATVAEDATVTLAAATKDASGNVLTGRAIAWSSSDTAMATVSQSGVVTGKKKGTATITATSEGKSGSAAITVTK